MFHLQTSCRNCQFPCTYFFSLISSRVVLYTVYNRIFCSINLNTVHAVFLVIHFIQCSFMFNPLMFNASISSCLCLISIPPSLSLYMLLYYIIFFCETSLMFVFFQSFCIICPQLMETFQHLFYNLSTRVESRVQCCAC